MPLRRVHAPTADSGILRAGLDQLRTELNIQPGFDPAVLDEAAGAATAPELPDLDLTAVPFATLDPVGSRDLDQAYAIERTNDGFRVRYAIADVGAFVRPGGALDLAAQGRVETLYLPDGRVPLYPPSLSEAAASLLPGERRPAVAWTLGLDASGHLINTDVRRALIRSREQQDYPTVQGQLDAGTATDQVLLLAEVGRLLQRRQSERGGMNLNVPSQEVVPTGDGWSLRFRASLPVEDLNAQLSLLTGMAAAELMLSGRVGVLRTLPDASEADVHRLRRVAAGLRIDWPQNVTYGELLARLGRPEGPRTGHVEAFLTEATSLFKGAAYVAFDGTTPGHAWHAAIAAPYAHCTAPLRRLADRYVNEVCVALAAQHELPGWTKAALPRLPELMARGDQRAHQADRGAVNLVEAAVLHGQVGDVFTGLIVDVDQRRGGGSVQIEQPAVLARCEATNGPLPLGESIPVRLLEADMVRRAVRFAAATGALR